MQATSMGHQKDPPKKTKEEHIKNLIQIIRSSDTHHTITPTTERPRLKVLKGIRAIIFDVYGTILSSAAGDISTAMATQDHVAIRKLTVHSHTYSLKDLMQRFISEVDHTHNMAKAKGIPYPEVDVRTIWKTIFAGMQLPPLTVHEIEKYALQYELLVNPSRSMPEASHTIQRLSRQGYIIGIVSNAQFFTPLLLRILMPEVYATINTRYCIWSYKEGIAKPDTALFTRLIDVMPYQKHELLFVGNDMKNDIWCASQVGMKTALFAGDARSYRPRTQEDSVKNIIPDCILTSLDQLSSCLSS